MVSKWIITPAGYNPLILTIDPNFLGHPSVSELVRRLTFVCLHEFDVHMFHLSNEKTHWLFEVFLRGVYYPII